MKRDVPMSPLQDTQAFAANKRLGAKIFTEGAVMFCPLCPRTNEKTMEEMAQYLNHWPFCKGTTEQPRKRIAAEVKLKPASSVRREDPNP